MSEYSAKVHMEPGGDCQVVEDGGEIKIESGGKITDDGTQASTIADISVTGVYADDDSNIETAVNAIIAALKGVGIIASS